MTTLPDFHPTDDVDDVLDDWIRELIASSLRSEFKNSENLSGTRTLLDADTPIQRLNCNGANRITKLPTADAVNNHLYLIVNSTTSGAWTLDVQSNGGTSRVVLAVGEAVLCLPDGNGAYLLQYFSADSIDQTEEVNYSDEPNYAVNGGFEFAQEQTPGTYTTISDKNYGPDQWWVTRENADVQYKREDGTAESGLTSKYFGTFKKITNTGKFFICQPLEGRDSVPLRGKTMIFPIKLKASGSKTIRMAVLELQTGGTMDAPPATLVTAFGANGVDPTFGTNVAIITAAQSKSVTTAFQQFSVSVTVPSNSKNLFLAIWTNDQFAANDTLSVAEADFYPGSAVRAWMPKKYDEDLAACRRYFFKTFDIDIAPVQNVGNTLGTIRSIAGKAGATGTAAVIPFRFPVRMFATPTVTTFNPSAANAQIRDSSAGADCSSTSASSFHTTADATTISATGNASTAVGNIVDVHITAKARIL